MSTREIKFRVWIVPVDPEEKPFMAVPTMFCIYDDGLPERVFINRQKYEDDMYGITLLQFTGLQDSNSKDVYEGDIVACKHGDDIINCEVVYTDHGFHQREFKEDGPMDSIWYYKFEVIGNIHENPELLE